MLNRSRKQKQHKYGFLSTTLKIITAVDVKMTYLQYFQKQKEYLQHKHSHDLTLVVARVHHITSIYTKSNYTYTAPFSRIQVETPQISQCRIILPFPSIDYYFIPPHSHSVLHSGSHCNIQQSKQFIPETYLYLLFLPCLSQNVENKECYTVCYQSTLQRSIQWILLN